MALPSPFAAVPEVPDSVGAWKLSSPLEALRSHARSFAMQFMEADDDVQSMMSGDDLMGAPVAFQHEATEEDPEEAEVAASASLALRQMMQPREESQDLVQQRIDEAKYKEQLQRVQRGVKSYLKLQNFNRSMWSETFGYGKRERRFPDFWEQQEKRTQEAIDNWPLNPARLEDMQKSDDVQDWVMVMLKILGIDEQDQAPEAGKVPGTVAARVRRRWRGHLQVAGTFTKAGTEFFYIDMSKGPFCVFPEKAVVMEIWREQRLVQVSAALVVNDWKEPRAGAFGRMLETNDGDGTVMPVIPQKGDGVAFPACQHFQRNFQDFIDGCLEPDAATG